MRSGLSRGLTCFVTIVIAVAITGCAPPVKVQPLVLPDKEAKIENQSAVPHENGYRGQKDELTMSSFTVKPTTVASGGKLSYQVKYTLSSSDSKREFKVINVITLSGPGGFLIELSRKTYKKPQGSHVSNLEFVVPPGLSPGSYKLTSTIKAAGQEKQQQCSFTVRRQQE